MGGASPILNAMSTALKILFMATLVAVITCIPIREDQDVDAIVPEGTSSAPVPPVMAVQHEPAQQPEAKKPEHEEDATMKVVAPFIAKCQGEMSPTDKCSLAKGFDPAKECNTHVAESQKCKSCKKKLLPCVMKAMKTAGIQPPKDDGDDHDGAFASWLMAVQQPDARQPEAKKPEHEEDATMKVVAPFIAKCQGEMSPTDKCSLAKGFDPAK